MKTIKQISSGLRVASDYVETIRKVWQEQVSNRSAIRAILLGVIFLLNSYLVPGGSPVMTEEMKIQAERSLFYFDIRYQPFSEELLKKCLEFEGVKYQEIVILQSLLETGYYTSDIFLNANNLFGMRYPKYRPTVATGIYREHARYAHWSDSVIDYALWQKWYLSQGYRIEGNEDNDFYLVFLNCIPYAEDKNYIPKLVKLSKGDLA
ncbi:MAG: glucosaminidase domain-containing protein [Bacteroidales bacterium]|nr:glucosaminidase domain-containing protein [Bacteroidales bacterium]